MSVGDLRKLHELHRIDLGLYETRKRLEGLDPGRAMIAEIKRLETELAALDAKHHALSGEQLDLELRQRTISEKLQKIDKELFGGYMVNPREVEARQKEIVMLKSQSGDLDVRILELWEEIPPVKEAIEATKKKIADGQKLLADYTVKLEATRVKLNEQEKELSAQRPDAAAQVPAPLLAKYEQNRKAHGGVGMTDANKLGQCSLCGTKLAVKIIEMAKDGRVVTCESCHRIVYATDGLI